MDPLPFVTLRALEPEDLEDLYRIENDPELWDVGITNMPYSRYALHEYIASVSGDIYTDRQLRLVVCDGEGHTVGMIDLANFDPQHRRAEVGIVIQKAFRDKGYGNAALAQLVVYARRVVHLHQLYAVVAESNRSCLKVFKDAGFQHNATLHDWLCDGYDYHDAWVLQYFL